MSSFYIIIVSCSAATAKGKIPEFNLEALERPSEVEDQDQGDKLSKFPSLLAGHRHQVYFFIRYGIPPCVTVVYGQIAKDILAHKFKLF